MRVKKLKRMCSVKGCNRTETFAITKTREFGGVIMCETCLREAIQAVENGGKFEPIEPPKPNLPLFYHPVADNTNTQTGVPNDMELNCPVCGKLCQSKSGLNSHMRVHKNGGDK